MKKIKNISKSKIAALLAASLIFGFTVTGCGMDASVEAEDSNTSSNSNDSSKNDNGTGTTDTGSNKPSNSGPSNGSNSTSKEEEDETSSTVNKLAYTLVWSDEFTECESNGTPLLSKWGYDVGRGQSKNTDGTNPDNWAWGNGELQWYSEKNPKNTYVSDGTLKIKAIKENAGSDATWTSGRIVTRNIAKWTYGYFEMKAKIPTEQGVWPAFWMLNNDIYAGKGWPASGEIDIMESSVSVWGKDKVYGTLHCKAGSGGSPVFTQEKNVSFSDNKFHTYAVEWTDKYIAWYYDDVKCFTYIPANYTNDPWPFNQDFSIIINLAVGGNLGGTVGANVTESTMEIDYVRVYQKSQDQVVIPESKYQAVMFGTDEDVSNPFGSITPWETSGISVSSDTKFNTPCKKISFTGVHAAWNKSCGGLQVSPAASYKANSKLKLKVYSSNNFYFKVNGTEYEYTANTTENWQDFEISLGSTNGTISELGFVSESLQDVYISEAYIE